MGGVTGKSLPDVNDYELAQSELNGFGRMPQERGLRHVFLAVAIATVAFLWFWSCSGNPSSPSVVKLLMFALLTVATSYLLECLCVFGEEIAHVNTRYSGSVWLAFQASLRLPDRRMLACCLSFPFLFVATVDDGGDFSPDVVNILIFVAFVCPAAHLFIIGNKHAVEMNAMPWIDESTSRPSFCNAGRGLAWAYYHGFLKHVIDNYQDSLANSRWGRKRRRKNCMFIFIPQNCVIRQSFETSNSIRHEGRFEIMKKTRAGVANRRYTSSMYSIAIQGERHYFHLEYPAILNTLYEMSTDNASQMDTCSRIAEVHEFFLTLHKIIGDNSFCKLVPFCGDDRKIKGILEQLVTGVTIDVIGSNPPLQNSPLKESLYSALVLFDPADIGWVNEQLLEAVEVKGFKLCLPGRDFRGGMDFQEVVLCGIADSDHVIIVFSQAFLKSREDYLTFIIESVFNPGKGKPSRFCIPVVVSPCSVPDMLSNLLVLDFNPQEKENFNRSLIQALQDELLI
eukprot:m.60937 g.60937  ORF g.60937 m.60937 type:complete len:510 (+) comp34956_c0_seq1:38-1567(+)